MLTPTAFLPTTFGNNEGYDELVVGRGHEPKPGPAHSIYLANCPFHELVGPHPGLVCTMNLPLVSGLIDGLGSGAQARLDPAEGRCCVTIDLP